MAALLLYPQHSASMTHELPKVVHVENEEHNPPSWLHLLLEQKSFPSQAKPSGNFPGLGTHVPCGGPPSMTRRMPLSASADGDSRATTRRVRAPPSTSADWQRKTSRVRAKSGGSAHHTGTGALRAMYMPRPKRPVGS